MKSLFLILALAAPARAIPLRVDNPPDAATANTWTAAQTFKAPVTVWGSSVSIVNGTATDTYALRVSSDPGGTTYSLLVSTGGPVQIPATGSLQIGTSNVSGVLIAVSTPAANATALVVNSTNARVGIGILDPTYPLHVSGNIGAPLALNTFGNAFSIDVFGAGGTPLARTNLVPNTVVGGFRVQGYAVTGYNSGARGSWQFQPAENWSNTAQGMLWLIRTTSSGTVAIATRMTIDHNGFIAVGSHTPGNLFDIRGGSLTVTGTQAAIGVGTLTPAATLDIVGNAQFGSGATKSTFTVTGALTLDAAAALTVTAASTFAGNTNFAITKSSAPSAGVGAATTAVCNAGLYVIWGGCDCTGGVALTQTTSKPNDVTVGATAATGWTCQAAGATGAACAAYVSCGKITNQ